MRELIVSGPTEDPRVAEQASEIRADAEGARERDLSVTEREAESFAVELRADDGSVTARWEDTVGRQELWARIDATPGRRRELRERAAEAK
jgi:hypothetical protein